MQSVSMHQRVEFFFRCSGASPTCNPFATSIHLPELAGLKKAGVYTRVLSEVADSFYPCRVGTVASSCNVCRGGLGVPDSEYTVSPCFFRCLGCFTQPIECGWLSEYFGCVTHMWSFCRFHSPHQYAGVMMARIYTRMLSEAFCIPATRSSDWMLQSRRLLIIGICIWNRFSNQSFTAVELLHLCSTNPNLDFRVMLRDNLILALDNSYHAHDIFSYSNSGGVSLWSTA